MFIYKKLIYDYYIENKLLFIGYFIVIIILYFLESIAISRLNAKLISSIDIKNIFKSMKNTESFRYIIYLIILYFIILFIYWIMRKIEIKLYPSFTSHIRKNIFKNTILKFSNTVEEIKIGKYVSRLSELTKEIIKFVHMIITDGITKVLIVLFIIFYMLYLNNNIGYIFLGYLFLIILVICYFGKNIMEEATKKCEIFLDMNEYLSDSLSNLTNVYLNNQSKNEINEHDRLTEEYKVFCAKSYEYSNNMSNLYNLLSLIVFIIVIIYVYKLFVIKKIDKLKLITIFILLGIFVSTSIKLSFSFAEIFHRVGFINASNSFVEFIYDNNSNNNNIKHKIINGNIIFKNISFSYKNNISIFKNTNLNIDGNKITVLMGQSGSGKSTLSKLLLKLHKQNSGDIYIDNININDYDNEYLREKIVYVNQRTNLFDKTIMENIKYGNNISDKDVMTYLKKYDLYSIFEKMEHGIYAKCGTNGSNLSLGMQKIVILLRGIFKNNYKIIIFDEPLAGLDQNSRGKVIKLIQDLSKNKNITIIIITHDKEITSIANKVINMNQIKNI
jgi:ABC-type multidrug transport system fused ATPase/permease subunit